jgi:hypothetical protein
MQWYDFVLASLYLTRRWTSQCSINCHFAFGFQLVFWSIGVMLLLSMCCKASSLQKLLCLTMDKQQYLQSCVYSSSTSSHLQVFPLISVFSFSTATIWSLGNLLWCDYCTCGSCMKRIKHWNWSIWKWSTESWTQLEGSKNVSKQLFKDLQGSVIWSSPFQPF